MLAIVPLPAKADKGRYGPFNLGKHPTLAGNSLWQLYQGTKGTVRLVETPIGPMQRKKTQVSGQTPVFFVFLIFG